MIHPLVNSYAVENVTFIERRFHDFNHGSSSKSVANLFYPMGDNVPVNSVPVVADEAINHDVDNNQPVGATYGEHFMQEIENLGTISLLSDRLRNVMLLMISQL